MPIEEGKAAPAFTLEDEFGAKVSLKDFRGSHVIVYFYPKDDTPGCTKEAYAFRDHWIDFNDEDAVIIGISPDDQTSQTVSHKTHAQFSVAQRPGEESNDQVRGIRGKDNVRKKTVGVIRSTVWIGPDGKVKKHWKRVSKAADHPAKVLEALRQTGA